MARLFVPLDVEFPTDERVLTAGPLAAYLYVCSLAYAKRRAGRDGSDGFVNDGALRVLTIGFPGRAEKHAQTLVDVGLWERVDGGWTIPAWLKHNKSSEQLKADKQAQREKSILGNHRRHHEAKKERSPDCPLCYPPEPSPQGDETLPPGTEPPPKGREREGRGRGTTARLPAGTKRPGTRARSGGGSFITTRSDHHRLRQRRHDAQQDHHHRPRELACWCAQEGRREPRPRPLGRAVPHRTVRRRSRLAPRRQGLDALLPESRRARNRHRTEARMSTDPTVTRNLDDTLTITGCDPDGQYPVQGQVLLDMVADINRLTRWKQDALMALNILSLRRQADLIATQDAPGAARTPVADVESLQPVEAHSAPEPEVTP